MVTLIGIPYDSNSSFLKGPSMAPARIRLMEQEGSANTFAENGIAIVAGRNYTDLGDIHFPTTDPSRAFGIIKETIKQQLCAGNKVLSLGGDHSISWPVLDAYTDIYPGLHVLHFDAHTDLYDNFDDNPYSHASPFARLAEKGKTGSITQVGIRTLTTHHREQAEKFGVSIIEMKDFNFDFIKELKGPLYISLDLDVLDPAFAPGISHHEPGGLSTRQLLHCIQSLPLDIVGADIVEYNPTRDINNMTAMVGYKMMKELIAKIV